MQPNIQVVECRKASWDQLLMLLRWRRDKMFSSLHIIHIERQNLLAQAVPHSIAAQTAKWNPQFESKVSPHYDYADIMNRIDAIGNSNRRIRKICLVYGVDALSVFYENLVASPRRELERIHEWLALIPAKIDLSGLRLQKQGGAENEAFIARFRSDALRALRRVTNTPYPAGSPQHLGG